MSSQKKSAGRLTPVIWGGEAAPLLPRSLREAWAAEAMPEWICTIADLPRGTGYGALGTATAEKLNLVSRVRVQNFVTNVLRSRLDSIYDLPAAPWAAGLQVPSEVVWSGRARTALFKTDLLSDSRKLAGITFGELSQMSGLGVRTLLDILCTLEAHLPVAEHKVRPGEQIELAMPDIEPYLAQLKKASGSSWGDIVSDADPRFKKFFPNGFGTFADRVDQILEQRDFSAAVALAQASEEIAVAAAHIESNYLEDLLGEVAQSFAKLRKEHHEALMCRLGWSGSPPVTLAEAGDMIGVTRERMRQLEAKVLRRIPAEGIYAPPVAKAVELLAAASPVPVERVPSLLLEAGLTAVPFYAESVISAAEAVGIEHTLRIEGVGGRNFVCAQKDGAHPKKVISMARRMSGAGGAARLSDVSERLAHEGLPISVESIRTILRGSKNVRFLGDDWVWFPDIPPNRSRLRNLTRRMLSVVSPIHVTRLRDGVKREVFYLNSVKGGWPIIVPPEDVLKRYYADHREFTISDHGLVGSVDALDYRAELVGTDQMLVDIIRAVPTGILDRASFREAAVRRGANPGTFEQAMTYSAVVERVGNNIWTARGLQLDPNAIEACREANARRPTERRVTDFGWTESGKAWFTALVPASPSPVLHIPGDISRFLADRRFAELGNGGAGLTIDKEGTSFGYGPILRRLGAEAGDVMVAEFDISNGTVSVRIGGSELEDDD